MIGTERTKNLYVVDRKWFDRLIGMRYDSQADFARRIEYPRDYITKLLSGERMFNARDVHIWADALGVTADELLVKGLRLVVERENGPRKEADE